MAVVPIAAGLDVSALPDWVGAFDHLCADLHEEFDPRLPSETIDKCFAVEVAKFHDARITTYLHILILRNTRARLRAIEARPLRTQR